MLQSEPLKTGFLVGNSSRTLEDLPVKLRFPDSALKRLSDNEYYVTTGGAETDPLSFHLNQSSSQTITGLSDGYLKITAGVIGTGAGGGGSTAIYSRAFTVTNPGVLSSTPLLRASTGCTITATHWLCVGGTSILCNLDELDQNGLNPVAVGTDNTAAAGVNLDISSFTNPGIVAGSWLGVHITTINGAPTKLIATLEYTIP